MPVAVAAREIVIDVPEIPVIVDPGAIPVPLTDMPTMRPPVETLLMMALLVVVSPVIGIETELIRYCWRWTLSESITLALTVRSLAAGRSATLKVRDPPASEKLPLP